MSTDDKTKGPLAPRPAPFTLVSIVSLLTAIGLGGLQLIAPTTAATIPGVFGTVSSWVSAGGIMGILALLIWGFLGNRKISVDQLQVENADRADVRDAYAEMVKSLSERLDQKDRHFAELEKHWREIATLAEENHRECVQERDELRQELRSVREEMEGLRRKFADMTINRVTELGERPSDHIREAAKSARRFTRRGADKGGKG